METLERDEIVARLHEHWQEIAVEFPRQDSDVHEAIFQEVIDCWESPGRHYHVLEHLLETLDMVKQLRHHCKNYLDIVLAAWYHDVVYVPGDKYNEEASAVLAAQHMHMLGFSDDTDRIGHVMEMISQTKHHEDVHDDPDFRVLSDADMSILAAESERYDRFIDGIAEEYTEVYTMKEFMVGRVGFISICLGRIEEDNLYYLPEMKAKNNIAKVNMDRELERWAV